MIQFNINNTLYTLQFIPIYGFGLGVLYYNPNLEPDLEDVGQEDYYEQVTVMLFVFGIHFTWFKL